MKHILFAFFFLSILCGLHAQIADISFNNNTWTTPAGASFSGNELTIIGSATKNLTSQFTVTIPSGTTEVYFVATVYLENIVGGPESFKMPKLKIYDNAGIKLEALNITEFPEATWFMTGIKISNYNKLNYPSLKLEFSIQNCTGTMKVKDPMLLSTSPTGGYSFPFAIPTDPSCSININTNEKHAFENDLLSMNSHFVWASYSWDDSEIINAINTCFPMSNMRFPGGTVGNFYDYTTDGFYNDAWSFSSPSRQTAYNNGFTFGFTGFNALCKANKATATEMFNVIEDDVPKAKNRLQDRINKGLDIKWIEMGNENFYTDQAFGNVSTLSNYVSHTKALTTGLKEIKSDIKVAVNIDKDDYSAGSWNATLANENYYDAVVFHPYVQTNTFMLNAFSAYVMLSSYKTTLERINKYKANYSKPLLFTEWNILSSGTPVNFIQSLSIADMFLAIEEGNQQGIVKQAGIHMLYHSDNYNESTLIYHDGTQMVKTANGVVYEKLFDVFKDGTVYNALSSSTLLDTMLPAVNARAVEQGDSIKVYVVNKLPVTSPLHIKINDVEYSGDYTLESFSIDPNLQLTTPYPINSNLWQTINNTGNIAIPAYSIAVATFVNPVITSFNDNSKKVFSIYPNPATTQLSIVASTPWSLSISEGLSHQNSLSDTKQSRSAEATITNTLGQTVSHFQINLFSNFQIDISQLQPGIYFIKIGNQVQKFIKQ